MIRQRYFRALLILLGCIAMNAFAADGRVERIAGLAAAGASDAVKKAVDGKGYRVTLEDGWSADFWFAQKLTSTGKSESARYPQLSNSEFIGVVDFPKGTTDFRGQAIPAGAYTLRYQLMPQDGNHMGVSPYPDFLLAIPLASDPNPEQAYVYKKLVTLSARSAGSNHPAVIALGDDGDPATVAKRAKSSVFTISLPSADETPIKLGIVVKGSAAEE